MKSRLRLRRVLLVLACVLSLAAAVGATWWNHAVRPAESMPTATSSAGAPVSATDAGAPLFASEEEALAAARATYEAFLAAADGILADGGESPERLDPYALATVLETEEDGFSNFRTRGLHSEGSAIIDNFELQSYSPTAIDGRHIVTIYSCINVANIDVFDGDGNSVVSEERPDRTPFEIAFDYELTSPTKLIISSKLVWSGAGVCG